MSSFFRSVGRLLLWTGSPDHVCAVSDITDRFQDHLTKSYWRDRRVRQEMHGSSQASSIAHFCWVCSDAIPARGVRLTTFRRVRPRNQLQLAKCEIETKMSETGHTSILRVTTLVPYGVLAPISPHFGTMRSQIVPALGSKEMKSCLG